MQTITERRSINLMNVKKVKKDPQAKSHVWDIENLSLSGAYSEEFMRDQFTDAYNRRQWSLGANYAFSSQAEPWQPFKNKKNSSPYYKWIKDFNIKPFPSTIAVGARLDRQFAKTQLRNSDFTTDGLDPFYEKAFTFTRNYTMQWPLTKSLNLDYNANVYAIVDEPIGDVTSQEAQDSIMVNLKRLGRMKTFSQNAGASYKLPFDKFPVTDWLNSDMRYNASYNWMAGPQGLRDDQDNLVNIGNNLQNTQQISANGKLDMEKLYNKVPFLKRIIAINKGKKLTAADDPKQIRLKKLQQKLKLLDERIARVRERSLPKEERTKAKEETDNGQGMDEDPNDIQSVPLDDLDAPILTELPTVPKEPSAKEKKLQEKKKLLQDDMKALKDEIKEEEEKKKGKEPKAPRPNALASLLLSVKDLNVSLSKTYTTTMPGFTPTPKYMGMDGTFQAPGLGFVFGSQDPTIINTAQREGWLAETSLQNMPFVQNRQNQLSIKATVEPINDFKIQLEASLSKNGSYSEIRRWNDTNNAFEVQSPVRNGGYTVSYFSMPTAFKGFRKDNTSAVFEQFRENLPIIKNRIDPLLGGGASGEVFDTTAQDVMIPAFIAAYSGKDASAVNISAFHKGLPIPGWKFTYNGLNKLGIFKERLKSISITHGYKSEYSTGSYTSSLFYVNRGVDFSFNFDERTIPFGVYEIDPVSGNAIVPVLVYNDVSLSEQFNPLIGINLRTKGNLSLKFDYRLRRDVGLNLSNAQITEQRASDISIDLGYSKSKMKLPFRRKVLENEVTFRMAFTLRNNKTVQHRLDEASVATNGNFNFQLKPTVNYQISKRTSFQAYFERNVNDPVVSNSPKRTTTAFGARLTFNLAE
jgi:cell surface protein SprA